MEWLNEHMKEIFGVHVMFQVSIVGHFEDDFDLA